MGMWAAGADPKRGALAPKCCLQGGAVSRAPQKGAVFAFRTGLFFSPLRSLRISILPFIVLPKIRCFSLRFWSLPPLPPYTLEDFFRAPFGSFSPLVLLRTFFALHSGLVSPHPFLPFPLTLCTLAPPHPPPHMAAVRFVVTPSRGADLSESSPEPPSASSSRPPPSDSSPSASETSAAAAAPRGERPLAAGGL